MIKGLVIFSLIGIFLLSGCEQLKELYGIQTTSEEEYVPIEDIKIEGESPVIQVGPEEQNETPKIEEPEEITEITEPEEEKETEEITKEEVGKSEGEAKVIIAEETDLVSLKPKASDPDQDKLSFSYTTPLDSEGKWQTAYGDEGEYTITITVSDGTLSTTKDVLIVINKKEEAPVIDEAVPEDDTLETKEDSKLEFSVKASDLNKDPLTYSWKLDGGDVSTKESYTYDVGYDAAGDHTVKVQVTDGIKEASKIWAVKVDNVNRKPALEGIGDIKVKEREVVIIEPKASDPDDDGLTFNIDSDKFVSKEGRFEWETTYDDAGEYTVKVTASDGTDEESQEVKIVIENVNRPPVIEDIILE